LQLHHLAGCTAKAVFGMITTFWHSPFGTGNSFITDSAQSDKSVAQAKCRLSNFMPKAPSLVKKEKECFHMHLENLNAMTFVRSFLFLQGSRA
jgi:hypothetical protein